MGVSALAQQERRAGPTKPRKCDASECDSPNVDPSCLCNVRNDKDIEDVLNQQEQTGIFNSGPRPNFIPKRCSKEVCNSSNPPAGCICDKNVSDKKIEDVIAEKLEQKETEEKIEKKEEEKEKVFAFKPRKCSEEECAQMPVDPQCVCKSEKQQEKTPAQSLANGFFPRKCSKSECQKEPRDPSCICKDTAQTLCQVSECDADAKPVNRTDCMCPVCRSTQCIGKTKPDDCLCVTQEVKCPKGECKGGFERDPESCRCPKVKKCLDNTYVLKRDECVNQCDLTNGACEGSEFLVRNPLNNCACECGIKRCPNKKKDELLSDCTCVPKQCQKKCKRTEILNEKDCICIKRSVDNCDVRCKPGYELDKENCECVCNKECPEGKAIKPNTCKCVNEARLQKQEAVERQGPWGNN